MQRDEGLAVLSTQQKLHKMEWDQLYRDKGLHWEAVFSRSGPEGRRVYSLHVTRRMRAVGFRDGDILRLLSLHPDHDSAYQ